MARNAINEFETQHIVKILSELSNCNAFLEITLVNLSKIHCQLIGISNTGTSAELKVITSQGQTIVIDVLDIYSLCQASMF